MKRGESRCAKAWETYINTRCILVGDIGQEEETGVPYLHSCFNIGIEEHHRCFGLGG